MGWVHLCDMVCYERNYKVLRKDTHHGQVTMSFREVRHECREYQGNSLEPDNKTPYATHQSLLRQSVTEVTVSGARHCGHVCRAGWSMFVLPNEVGASRGMMGACAVSDREGLQCLHSSRLRTQKDRAPRLVQDEESRQRVPVGGEQELRTHHTSMQRQGSLRLYIITKAQC